MSKNRRIITKGLVFLLMALLVTGMLPTAAFAAEGPSVTITSVTEADGVVKVTGTTEALGQRKVEIIVNGDLDLRYVAKEDANGNFVCEFELPYNGEYTVEASIRDYSDFNAIRQTTPDENYFEMDGACTWGSSVVKHTDGFYYMIFSTWDEERTFDNWNSASELGFAVSTKPSGPYIYQGRALDRDGSNITNETMPDWGGGALQVFHNPNLMRSERDGKYYLYFTTHGESDGQRVGVAVADTPAGPWTVSEQPVINTREGYHDNSYVCNPSVVEVKLENGEYLYYAIYRSNGVEDGTSTVIRASAYATASSPLGPFKQSDELIMRDPTSDYSVEDCYVWYQNGQYYALAKDMTKGKISGYTDGYSYALFESKDGVDWYISENKLAFPTVIPWESGDQKVHLLDRSQLFLEDGIPFLITNATTTNGATPYGDSHTCNVQIPLLGTIMASDSYTLSVSDGKDKTVDKSKLQALLPTAKDALKENYTKENWWKLYTATRAGEILNARENTDQGAVDLAVEQIRQVLDQKIDPSTKRVNIALNKEVTASSTYLSEEWGNYPAELAVDGDISTRWGAANGTTGTITFEINLSGQYRVDGIMIDQFAPRITEYMWEYFDGISWKECCLGEGSSASVQLSDDLSESIVAEKLRLNINKYSGTPSIFEIEVYGTKLSENIVLNKPITANSNYNDTYSAVKAVDGKADADTTRWGAKGNVTGTVSLEIDLDGRYYIDNFRIDEFMKKTETTGRITNYSWEYYDGTEWKTCFTGTNAGGMSGASMHFHLAGDFGGEIAEKLRLNLNTYTASPSIWEIEVFGTKAYGNIALNQEVSASSIYPPASHGTYYDTYAVDGDVATRWGAASGVAGTVTFDIKFDNNYCLDSFKIVEFADRITSFSWQYYDGSRWVTCYEGTNAGAVAGGTNIINLSGDFTDKSVTDRLRLNILSYSKEPSIWEIEVYGSVVRSESVSLDKESLELLCGETAELTATVAPENATNKAVTWSSSDESVATVGANGKITAVGAGSATITVTAKDMGHTDTCTITVAHTAGDLIVDTAATCSAKGTGHKDCTACGLTAESNIEIPVDADNHAGGTTVKGAVSATCGTAGYTGDTYCLGCDEKLADGEATAATGNHTAGEMQVVTPATATTAGVGEIRCTACNALLETVAIPAAGVASIGEKTYETLEEALSDAKAGDVIKLNADVTVDYITIDPEVILDLNGKMLTADYIIGFNSSVVCGEGKLIVAKDKVALDRTNGGYLPVYDGKGYRFITVTMREAKKTNEQTGETCYYFSPDLTAAHDELSEGATPAALEVVVRLTWTKADNYKATQSFIYLDEMVKTVVESYNADLKNHPMDYASVFLAAFAGSEAESAEDLTISAVLISNTGVEVASSGISFAG